MSFNGDNTCHYEILLYAILLLMPFTKKGLPYAQFIIDMGNCISNFLMHAVKLFVIYPTARWTILCMLTLKSLHIYVGLSWIYNTIKKSFLKSSFDKDISDWKIWDFVSVIVMVSIWLISNVILWGIRFVLFVATLLILLWSNRLTGRFVRFTPKGKDGRIFSLL